MTDSILVVGGYGTVGRTVCRTLAESTDRPVLAGGRNWRAAQRFAATADGVEARHIDVADSRTYDEALRNVETVVVCFDQKTVAFPQACFERGIDYFDTSPTDTLLRAIEECDDVARAEKATGILSLGLSPGLTNLFAAAGMTALDYTTQIDITLLLGLGEEFGPDTIKWTLEDGLDDFTVRTDGVDRDVVAFTDGRVTHIPGWGRRRVYRANLADQHVLARTTTVPTVATRLCYSSHIATKALAMVMHTVRVDDVVSGIGIERLARTGSSLAVGAAESVVMTEVQGVVGDCPTRHTRWLRGPDQARATGLVAAQAIQQLDTTSIPTGVHHLHQVFDLEPFCERLLEAGYALGESVEQTSEPSIF